MMISAFPCRGRMIWVSPWGWKRALHEPPSSALAASTLLRSTLKPFVGKGRREGSMKRVVRHGNYQKDSSFVALLKACAKSKDICEGTRLHVDILKKGLLERNPYLGSAVISMYSKWGMLHKAQQVLDKLPVRDIVCWNALITGYAHHERGLEAIHCFDRLQSDDGLSPNEVTFISILKACGSTRSINKGKQIHDVVLSLGMLDKYVMLGTALVDMYAKCGIPAKAQDVLEELPIRNIVSWNALISGYAQQGQAHEVLTCFEHIKSEGVPPDEVTFLSILKACGSLGDVDKGTCVYNEIVNRGLLEKHSFLRNAVVDMYGKCGALAKAQEVLEEFSNQDIASWNALIAGYVQHGKGDESLSCLEKMQHVGLSADAVTYTCILKACSERGVIDKGKQIHEVVVSKGLLGKDVVLGNALVDMYARCGFLEEARNVLEKLPERHVFSWSALIGGYAQQGQGHEALNCFEQMQNDGLSPDMITFICLLKACASIGAGDRGKQIHDEVVSRGFLAKNTVVGTAVVDMYAKCGLPRQAQQVLEGLIVRNRVSWSALIAGYAQQGQAREALNCFERMLREGIEPDEVIFLCVLSACSHSGLLNESQMLFGNMTERYGIVPAVEHHTCMVSVFGFAGHFERALSIIMSMTSSDNPEVWLALLGACRKWGNVKLGILAFDQIVQLDCNCAAAYVFMAKIFAAAGMQEDADKLDAMKINYNS